jgi:C_GCAxxG_C_C family probable redox protein
MNTKDRAELAKKYFTDGYNCAQAVVLAFCDELDIDKNTALALSSSFGGGVGRLREVCGAVSGMCIVAGLKYGYISPTDKEQKTEHYALIQELAKEFESKNGSIICKMLIGQDRSTHVPADRTEQYYQKRPCADLVYDAAEIMQDIIIKKQS